MTPIQDETKPRESVKEQADREAREVIEWAIDSRRP